MSAFIPCLTINCQIAFYDQIKQIKQGPRHFTGHPSHETDRGEENPKEAGVFFYINCLAFINRIGVS